MKNEKRKTESGNRKSENPKPVPSINSGQALSQAEGSKIESGFTLLEVVVAMAIVGLGVVTLLEVFSYGLRLEASGAARTDAVVYSRQVMDEFLTRKDFDGRGDAGSFGKNHRWRVDTSPLRDDSDLAPKGWDVTEITLRMRYPDGERDKLVEMKTLRVQKTKRQ
ncbi:MAG TPA: prepilin-type N-terminal cleavage/methylation domain-containing protein [Candidatus Binatia bacterium]|jgi:general secretion pathway protein I